MSQATESVRALLVDGEQIELRPATHSDEYALIRLHDELSERSVYLRFFTTNHAAGADFVHRVLQLESPSGYCLVAVLAGEIVGMVSYQTLDTPERAEVALSVADRCQSRGVGTLLLEHVVSYARQHGINAFHAEVLAENSRMLRVFFDIGLTPTTRRVDGTLQVEIPLRYDESYLDAVTVRERRADVASLTPLLEPTSVAVIGVSHRGAGAGYAVLTHLLESGFHGPIHPVNPHATQIAGLRVYPSVSEIPEPPELAVLSVPAAQVPDVAEQCGRCGVRALVVLSSGLTTAAGRRLIDIVHQFGMRMVGPNCIGLANTEPTVALDASFTRHTASPGHVGIVTQSGGIGIALLESLAQAGLGVSTFVSTGDKYDVSSNDMLLWWGQDERTKVGVVYVESFGNPRKFSRLARQLASRTPVVAVRAAASAAAQKAAQSHTAASATPAVTRDALFRQAGVIPTDDLQETVDVVALLSCQPIPDGSRVAIISNAGGGGVLAADACERYGLQIATISNRDALSALLGKGTAASVVNPIDTSAGVSPDIFADCIVAAAADPNVDAVLAIIAPTALGDLRGALDVAAAKCSKPLVGAVFGQPDTVHISLRSVPVYGDPATALRALGHAASYAAWRRRPSGTIPQPRGIRPDEAAAAVMRYLTEHPSGGWLDWATLGDIAQAYGIPLPQSVVVTDAASAQSALSQVDGPVAMKALVDDLVHRTEEHALELGVETGDQARAIYERMSRRYGSKLRGVLVQHMASAGQEFLIGVVQDSAFGPLVQIGAGGTATELLQDRATRLLPLTDIDATQMLQSLHVAPLLAGFRGSSPLDSAGLLDLVHRVARLAEDLPQVVELDLNPVIVRPRDCVVVDMKVRVAPAHTADPFLRRLR